MLDIVEIFQDAGEDVILGNLPQQTKDSVLQYLEEVLTSIEDLFPESFKEAKEVKQTILIEVLGKIEDMKNFSCGHPESRLCDCHYTMDAYGHVTDMLRDEYDLP